MICDGARVDNRLMRSRGGITVRLGILTYLALFSFNSIFRTYVFSDPDTMNFVDVARNVANGRGLTQSTLGFNQPHFSPDADIPSPFVDQAPLYPLLVASLIRAGIPSPPAAALLLSALSYGFVLLLAVLLARKVFDERVARLSLALLLVYAPLRSVSRTAFSESTGLAFLLLTFLLLVESGGEKRRSGWWSVAAGVAAGSAFATRYALVLAVAVGAVFLWLRSRPRVRNVVLFLAGCAVPIGLVLAHNVLSAGRPLPRPLASGAALGENMYMTLRAFWGTYMGGAVRPVPQALLLFGGLLVLASWSLLRKDTAQVLRFTLGGGGRGLLLLWIVGYLAFLLYERSHVQFDPIDARLTLPAGVIACVLLAAFVVASTGLSRRAAGWLMAGVLVFVLGQEVLLAVRTPRFQVAVRIAGSERLTWVERHTTDRDLVIGNDAVDVPFYFGRDAGVSFSPYPYTDYPAYDSLVAFSRRHCDEYGHIYLLVTGSGRPDADRRMFGPFIGDLASGQLREYPALTLVDRLSDGYAFEFRCGGG